MKNGKCTCHDCLKGGLSQVFKLLQLFNITNVNQICNLGKYICRALKLRADTVAFTFLNCIFN